MQKQHHYQEKDCFGNIGQVLFGVYMYTDTKIPDQCNISLNNFSDANCKQSELIGGTLKKKNQCESVLERNILLKIFLLKTF